LLILPIQRMPRYKLLLQEIIKYTNPTHPDWEQLNNAFQKISEVNDAINDKIKLFESRMEVQAVENRFGGKVNDLVIPSRRYIHQGKLCKIDREEHIYFVFILFNDCILYAAESKNSNNLTLGNILHFDNNFSVKKTSGFIKTISNLKHLFELHSTKESFFLYAQNKQEMEDWLEIIDEAYHDHIQSGTIKKEDKLFAATLFIPKDFTSQCMVNKCSKKFSGVLTSNKRYHCRNCGFAVCGACSKKKLKIRNYKELRRVCDLCYEKNKNNQGLIKMHSERIKKGNLLEIEGLHQHKASQSTMELQGYERSLVTGYLRRILLAKRTKKELLLGIDPKLPGRIIFICNLLYGSITRDSMSDAEMLSYYL